MGYYLKVGRLLFIALFLVIIGSIIFLPDQALRLASDSVKAYPWETGWSYRFWDSVDLFLPVVNLGIDKKWEPRGPLLQTYAAMHAMIGWIIVPLLVAALAGIIRR